MRLRAHNGVYFPGTPIASAILSKMFIDRMLAFRWMIRP
jgi:hypothetical protein